MNQRQVGSFLSDNLEKTKVEQLLTTKLNIPPTRPQLVFRSRLIARLNEGLNRKLTLISAPAGYGKTTLVVEWLRQRDQPFAWLTLDGGDNDLVRFLDYLVASWQKVYPNIGQTAQAILEAPQAAATEQVFTCLINEIAEKPLFFVLDDYHVIEESTIHEALTYLLDHMPLQLHLVITTRADPPLPIPRLRGRGQLCELHAEDLRFALDEVEDFLTKVMGLVLYRKQIIALERHTEGWITGLQMAALSMQGRENVSEFIQAFTGSHRYILDYLTEEVLNQQKKEIEAFLLHTSILDRLTGPLCDMVTQQANSHSILVALESANLFLVPLDEERRWYRYHHLFADTLQSRLRASDPDLFKKLHQRAAAWFEKQGLFEYAIRHAAVGGWLETAADLVESNAISMLGRGELFALMTLIELLEALMDERPWLSIYKSWGLALSGQLDQAERWRQRAEAVIGAKKVKPSRHMLGHIAAIEFYCASYRGKMDTAVAYAQKALELLPENKGLVRGIVTTAMGYSLRFVGEYAQAEAALEVARRAAREAGNRYLELRSLSTLSALAFDQCRLHRSRDLAREALQQATLPSGQMLPSAGWALVGLGLIHYEWNDLEVADEHTRKAMALGPKWGDPFDLVHMFLLMADIRIALGDIAGAQQSFERGEAVIRSYAVSPGLVDWVQAARARYWLKQGDLEAAVRWALYSGISANDEISLFRTNQYRTRARVYLATEQYEEALELLMGLQEQVEAAGRTRSLLQTLVLRSLAHQTLNDTPQALNALKRALKLSQTGGFIRIFVDEGRPLARLLRIALRENINPDYIGQLLACFSEPTTTKVTGEYALVELLSERELEVLRLIAAGLSNQEIAQELVIAVSTVKSHINHIYGKLEVKSRTQAVALGQALGLL
ncbi:MAG: LuxR C-terminal-related transcriptional regulator [Candidatus Promineifilaceae bacterium]|nr:LuxR C-terminal-related transcriptional regulator [Candidatus Promineifilaceae bacterium]